MHPPPVPFIIALALAAALPPGAHAQDRGTGIQRCERPDGTRVYTDQDCAAFAATPVPVEGELLPRLAGDTGGGGDAPAPGLPAESAPAPAMERAAGGGTAFAASPSGGRHSAGTPPGCARSPTQLVMDLRTAWQQGDVNRLAASYHWAGSGTREATSVMSRLQSLVEAPLQDVRHFGGSHGAAMQLAGTGRPAGGDRLHVTLDGEGHARVRDLRLVHHQGCYFVRF